jgi:hypothetical protein
LKWTLGHFENRAFRKKRSSGLPGGSGDLSNSWQKQWILSSVRA